MHKKLNPPGPGALVGFDVLIARFTSLQVKDFQMIGGFGGIS
jgi:hypothetical protein